MQTLCRRPIAWKDIGLGPGVHLTSSILVKFFDHLRENRRPVDWMGVRSPSQTFTPQLVAGGLRIRDVDLGKRLRFANPVDIRKLICRYEADLERTGFLPA